MIDITPRDSLDIAFMREALDLAARAMAQAEVPVGALVVRQGVRIAGAGNAMRETGDATAHAEMRALRAAAALSGSGGRLDDCTLYVTLEPCAMCAGAIILARVARVVFGAFDEKAGMAGSVGDLLRHPRLNHRPEVLAGVLAEDCGAQLSAFFAARRR